MKHIAPKILLFLILFVNTIASAQNNELYHFKFIIKERALLNELTRKISIDRVFGDTVYAYANQQEFTTFKLYNFKYTLIDESSAAKSVTMATTLEQMQNWDRYPTYEVYEELMNSFAQQYSHICRLENIGTLASGRKILAVIISDNPANNFEAEPKVFYTSTMHGDETAGYVLMLKLIDYLLKNYNYDEKITQLINNTRIFINPLANPNGTYNGGNSTVSLARRTNGNNIDLNRNFPAAGVGENPDGYSHQEETLLFIDFAKKYKFNLATNIHAGTEVVNYPWDYWSKLPADDAWWRYVGGNYRDTVQANSPSGYFTDINNGLTNGYAWYQIAGGRQDYMNYYHGTREFTLEISGSKIYPSESLPNLWNYNKAALLNYMQEAHYGIQGTILDASSKPVKAKIEVLNYDIDNSWVYSDSLNGYYARYLKEGEYNLKISAEGYAPNYYTLSTSDGKKTELNIILEKPLNKLCFSSESIEKSFDSNNNDSLHIDGINCGNDSATISFKFKSTESTQWLKIKHKTIKVASREAFRNVLYCDTAVESDTTLTFELQAIANETYSIAIKINLKAENNLKTIYKSMFLANACSVSYDSILIINNSNKNQALTISSTDNWLTIAATNKAIPALDSTWITLQIDCTAKQPGLYSGYLKVNETKYPIKLLVDPDNQIIAIDQPKQFTLLKGGLVNKTITIANISHTAANIKTSMEKYNKHIFITTPDAIAPIDTQNIIISILTDSLPKGTYNNNVLIQCNKQLLNIPLNFTLDTSSQLKILTDTILIKCYAGETGSKTLNVTNTGGDILQLSLMEETSNFNYILSIPNKINPISSSQSVEIPIVADATSLKSGNYIRTLIVNGVKIPIHIAVYNKPLLNIEPKFIFEESVNNQTVDKDITISNTGTEPVRVYISHLQTNWLNINATELLITGGSSKTLRLNINLNSITEGKYSSKIILSTIHEKVTLPVTVNITE